MYCSFKCANHTNRGDLFSNLSNALVKREIKEEAPIFEEIGGRRYQNNLVLLEADILFNIARKQWQEIEDFALGEINARCVNVAEYRKQIMRVLSVCYKADEEKALQYVKLFKISITRWVDFEESSLKKLACKSVKDEKLPLHHYFHLYLDVHWLMLKFSDDQEEAFKAIVEDLVVFCAELWKKNDDVTETLFVCPCFKQLWLLLQFFAEQHKSASWFWEIFNECLKNCDEIVSLWLLQEVAELQGYDKEGKYLGEKSERIYENHALVEAKLKGLNVRLTTDVKNNDLLKNCCKVIDSLLNRWWVKSPKSEHYQVLWEIFNKHLDIFPTPKIASAMELVELVDNITTGIPKTGYYYFLSMLNNHLKNNPNQWMRIKGRIYCKLPPHKIKEMNDTGIGNIAILFLVLTRSISISEITQKLTILLACLNSKLTPLVFNIYLSIIILHVRQELPITQAIPPLIQLVQDAVENRKLFHLVRVYVEGFDAVLNASLSLHSQQHLMIGSWLGKYLASCEYNELCYLLNVLLYIVRRVWAEDQMEWNEVLREHVLPALKLKTVSMCPNSPPQVGELAALIEPNPCSDWVFTFTADLMPPQITSTFICTLLERLPTNYALPKNHETAVLHAWIRCCLLNCEDSVKLTRNVLKIRALSVFDNEFELCDKPLVSVVVALSKRKENLQELYEQCFGRLDSWVVGYLKDPGSEGQVVHMYTCIAVLFFRAASMLYHKNRATCLLSRLISIFLLPSQVLMGNPPHKFVLSAVQRTWHRFVEGIFVLDCTSDAYLERTLKDMVLRYLHFFSVQSSPILKCLHNEDLTLFIMEKLSTGVLAHAARSSDTMSNKATKIIQMSLDHCSNDLTRKILYASLTSIFEVILFKTDKQTALEVVTAVAGGRYGDLQECIGVSIMTITEKNLAFNANNFFQFAAILAKAIPDSMRAALPSIKKQMTEVERMRGVGYDNTLRQAYDRLQKMLPTQ